MNIPLTRQVIDHRLNWRYTREETTSRQKMLDDLQSDSTYLLVRDELCVAAGPRERTVLGDTAWPVCSETLASRGWLSQSAGRGAFYFHPDWKREEVPEWLCNHLNMRVQLRDRDRKADARMFSWVEHEFAVRWTDRVFDPQFDPVTGELTEVFQWKR